jgi:hypothetical protein
MQRGIKRRIEGLEQSILPLTDSVFLGRVKKHAQRRGISFDLAMQSLISKVSDGELESLEAEFERIAFGDDTAARDAAKRAFYFVAFGFAHAAAAGAVPASSSPWRLITAVTTFAWLFVHAVRVDPKL